MSDDELIKRIDKISRKVRRNIAYAYRHENDDMVESNKKDLEALNEIKRRLMRNEITQFKD